ncbi:hypothetical protein I7I48_07462 [Histoplasma ohiense]|nr:hypothetical protein I7I48_07462 [Histoplasma ohiense (nom. inval.)]
MFLSPWLGKRSSIKSSVHQAHDVAAFKRKEGKIHNYFSSLFFFSSFLFFFFPLWWSMMSDMRPWSCISIHI